MKRAAALLVGLALSCAPEGPGDGCRTVDAHDDACGVDGYSIACSSPATELQGSAVSCTPNARGTDATYPHGYCCRRGSR